jgi:hypothetical protein
MATTPLEREILAHYATSAGPYRGGTQHWTPTHVQIIQRFIDLGLLICPTGAEGLQRLTPNEQALRVYMAALAAVPLPVQRWVVPATPDALSDLSEAQPQRPGSRSDGLNGGNPDSTAAAASETQARVVELERQIRDLQGAQAAPRRQRYEAEED